MPPTSATDQSRPASRKNLVTRLFCFLNTLGACRRRTPRSCVDVKAPNDASRRSGLILRRPRRPRTRSSPQRSPSAWCREDVEVRELHACHNQLREELPRRVCTHVSAQVYTQVYLHVHAHVYARIYTHVCTHVHTHGYTHGHTPISIHTCPYTCPCTCLYTCLCAHVDAHVDTHAYAHVYTHVHTHVCAHAYTRHTCLYTCPCAHLRTHLQSIVTVCTRKEARAPPSRHTRTSTPARTFLCACLGARVRSNNMP